MDHRREIDGLRAVAVLPVMLFHAGIELFGGGFVGVDVFFVISGYLITSIILAEKQAGTFSLVGFYERRARRILPALFVVMSACFAFAWHWLLMPGDMKEFSQSVIAVSVFSSNVFFSWMAGGYFDTGSTLKPLLHTWSLAVEEQYYLLFPLIILLVWRRGMRWVVGSLVVAMVGSLAAARWGASHMPVAAFYLLPTRAWELLIGAFIACHFFCRPDSQHGRTLSQVGSLVGLLLVVFALVAFSRSVSIPISLRMLTATAGTALLIVFASPQTLVGTLLGSRPLVGIGLVSYSAYLWHQPLFAFTRLRSLDTTGSPLVYLLLCGLALVLAYFTWRYVERPFRDRRRISTRTVFIAGLAMAAILISLGLLGDRSGGFPDRLSAEQKDVAAYREKHDYGPIYRIGECFLDGGQTYKNFSLACKKLVKGHRSLLIWGDSHAAALAVGLRATVPNVIQYAAGACPPIVDKSFSRVPNCKDANDFVIGEVGQIKPDIVLLHADWLNSGDPESNLNVMVTVDRILRVSPSSRIFIVGSVPQWSPTLPLLLLRKGMALNKPLYMPIPQFSDLKAFDDRLRTAATARGVTFLSALDALCDNEMCLAVLESNGTYEPTAWDSAHLTESGSLLLARKLMAQVGG